MVYTSNSGDEDRGYQYKGLAMMINLNYTMDQAKRLSGQHMDTVYIHEFRMDGKRYYDASFSEVCLFSKEPGFESSRTRAVYHNDKLIRYED